MFDRTAKRGQYLDCEKCLRLTVQELIKPAFSRDLSVSHALSDAFELTRLVIKDDLDAGLRLNGRIRANAAKYAREKNSYEMLDIYKKSLLLAAPHDFDSAFLYAEWNRDARKRFYQPRRKQLYPVVKALEDLANRKIRVLGIMAPPGIGKTTVAEMAMVMMGLRNPELSILGASHSNSFLRGLYDEMLRMLDPEGDYLFCDIYPEVRVVRTNAQDMRIDLSEKKRFETFEFSSVGSGNAGKVRASNLLYADDLVDGIESAMSKERMDKLWQQYYTDLRQRMIGDCVELLIQTPWSLHDPIDRMEQMYQDDPTARFIHLPATDENGESNFDYPYGVGFTTKFYKEQKEIMDDASWRALYMTQPIEREGQLYPEDELRRYFELPDREPDAILAVCDTKDKGSDYCVMPIGYKYGEDYYIDDVVCENYAPDIVEDNLVSALLRNKVHMSQFESNAAGGKVAEKVQAAVRSKGGRTKITTKWTTAHKETKIIVNAPFIKEHFLFKDNSVIKGDREYRTFLSLLCGYTMAGKNMHDDVPDAMAQFAEYVQGFTMQKVQVIRSPWSM